MEIGDNLTGFSTAESWKIKVFHKAVHNFHSLWEIKMWKKKEADRFLQIFEKGEKSGKQQKRSVYIMLLKRAFVCAFSQNEADSMKKIELFL